MILWWFLIMGLVMGGVLVFSANMMWKYVILPWRWPIRVPVGIQRGENIVWDLDERAYHKTEKDGFESLRLRKRKDFIKPPKYEHVSIDKKGKAVYPVYNTARGQYFPIEFIENANGERRPRIDMNIVEDKSAKNWAVQALRKVQAKYAVGESKWLRWAPYFMSATFAAMIIFFVIYFGGKVEIASNALAGASANLASAMEMFTKSPPPPPP